MIPCGVFQFLADRAAQMGHCEGGRSRSASNYGSQTPEMGVQMLWGACRPLLRRAARKQTPGGGRRRQRRRAAGVAGLIRAAAPSLLNPKVMYYISESALGQAGGLEARIGGC